jgi:outer membrane protein OmpA-like peptidoglycan-associated protein/tetratricopeptide (TPR) repeat protein
LLPASKPSIFHLIFPVFGKATNMLNRTFFAILLSCFSFFSHGQNSADIIGKADKLFAKKNYSEAAKLYDEVVRLNSEDAAANFKLGVTYLNLNQKTRSLPYLEKAFQINPEVDLDIDYHLGLAYEASHEFAKAIRHFEEFGRKNRKLSNIAQNKIYTCKIADSVMQHPAYVDLENVSAINSTFHEYSPIMFPDGNTIIFTSNRSTDDFKIKSGTNFEDIYITKRNETGFTTPHRVEEINDKYHDAASSLSPDGKTLFIYYEVGAGDIYTSVLEDGKWSKPEPLNRNINTPLFWETSASLSADGQKLFFTSNRTGGKGELDIYVSEKDGNGEWGKAYNLGPVINTAGNEDSPFLHADGVTIYFSSDGHDGLGSNDIFKSEWKNGKFTKAVNLGYPINSIEYDGFFSLSADKKTGYYSTLREGGKGEADIYIAHFQDPPPPPVQKEELIASVAPTIELVDSIKAEEETIDPLLQMQKDLKVVTILKGKVIDEVTGAPLNAVITLVDNETNKVITKIKSNATSGDFELIVPHGGNYGVATERTGYLFNSINFNVPQFAEYQEIDMSIIMVKAEVGSKATLKNIFFDVGKAELKNESLAELEKLFELLTSNPSLKVQINGHTDNTGNAASNKILSLRRAESVIEFLIKKGMETSRLSAKGFGSERPLVSNDDETEGREINRRTEIEIIK